MYNKLNFATQENIYKWFQEQDKLDILMRTMRLLGTRITLTRTRQIVIIDLDYNACSSNQAEKRISRIGQSNISTAHILVCTNVTIEQQIRKHYDKRKEIQKMTMKKAWTFDYKSKLNLEIK